MSKDIDDILKSKLEKAEVNPPPQLWDKIAAGLPGPDAQAAFDHAIREKLADTQMEAPKGLWVKIISQLRPASLPFYRRMWFKVGSAALILLLAFFGIYRWLPATPHSERTVHHNALLTSPRHTKPIQAAKVVDKKHKPNKPSGDQNVKQKVRQPARVSFSPIKTLAKDKNAVNIPSKPITAMIEQGLEVSKSEASLSRSTELAEEAKATDTQQEKAEELPASETAEVAVRAQEAQEKIPESTGLVQPEAAAKPGMDTLTKHSPLPEAGKLRKNPRHLNRYGLGLSYSPSTTVLEQGQIARQDFNLSLHYQNISFIADMGLGLGFSTEKEPYSVDYKHYEFVKMQFVTDSLGFAYDSTSGSFIPVPYGHHEKVYDDVNYSYSSEATLSYTYLTIPLQFGYQWDRKHMAFFTKAGLNYSLTIRKTVSGTFEPDENTTIQSIYYPVHTRYTHHLAFSLSAGALIKLNQNWTLNGELIGNYYQAPLYRESQYRPYAYGFRVGAVYYFDYL